MIAKPNKTGAFDDVINLFRKLKAALALKKLLTHTSLLQLRRAEKELPGCVQECWLYEHRPAGEVAATPDTRKPDGIRCRVALTPLPPIPGSLESARYGENPRQNIEAVEVTRKIPWNKDLGG